MTPELSRPIRVDTIGTAPRHERIEASDAERAALAARFDLPALDHFAAALAAVRTLSGIHVTGRVTAAGAQACVVSAEPVRFAVDESVDLTFTEVVPEGDEIDVTDPDVLPLDGDALDLGEIAAQSLGLALDPYPRASDAVRDATARFLMSEDEASELAAADKVAASPFASLRRTP